MRCPRCALAELSETTQTCALCGYSPPAGSTATAVAAPPAPSAPIAPAAPTELDARRELAQHFRIERLLESPSVPFTYLAQDGEGRPLVLKVVPLTELGLPADRVLAALESAKRLDHPHIIPVHDSGTTVHFLWYATKPIEGRSVATSLETVGAIQLPVCLRLLEQVASALDYAHRRGVAHGALRPECVLVDANEWVLVGDFGTAGLVRSPDGVGAAASDGAGADQRALARLARQCLMGRSAGDGSKTPPGGHLPLSLQLSQALRRATSIRQADLFPSVLDFVAALGGGAPAVGHSDAREVGNARPTTGLAWFSAKPRNTPVGPPVIADTDDDPAVSQWRRRVAAAAGVVLALGAGAAWLGLSSVPAAPAGSAVAVAPTLSPPPSKTPMPQPVTVMPGPDTAATAPTLMPSPRPVRAKPEPMPPRASAPAPVKLPPPRRAPARAPTPSATPITTPPPDRYAEPALLAVNAIPWGSVFIDGRPVGNTPLIDITLPAGTHRLRVERDGFRPYDRMISLAPGQRLRITDIALVER
ncbi:MAG TPA: PEGA domain-containing protein [Gemmatimonadales bacterium]|nr:PEGA domain-containing protein [Gemmatimonadales bacterium]